MGKDKMGNPTAETESESSTKDPLGVLSGVLNKRGEDFPSACSISKPCGN